MIEGRNEETKTAKAVRILRVFFKQVKAAYKWSSENLTMGKVIKWGMILLVVVAAIGGYFFG